MAQNLIRNGINHGTIVAAELAGHRIYLEDFHAEHFENLRILPEDTEIGEFHPVRLSLSIYDLREAYVYVPTDANIRAIGEAMSSSGKSANATAHARFLAFWKDGKLVNNVRKLSEFYSNISQEEDDKHSF